MKRETKEKLKNFTIEVLDFFLGIPEGLINSFDRKEFYRAMNGFPAEKRLTCTNISRFISNFKRHGYIEIAKTNLGESIRFTDKARLSLVDRVCERSVADSQYRFVSFDIPEALRLNRNRFRRTINRLGFRQIQKSLWVCNKNIGDYVEMAAKEYGVEEYVVYIISENTNINSFINTKLSEETHLREAV